MAEFAYNNAKNLNISNTLFELNCGYYLCVLVEIDVNSRSKSRSADKLLAELQELILVYCNNLLCTLKLQKQAHNKVVKPKSYVFDEKV